MKVTPLHDRLVVPRLDEGEQIMGRIIVPDSAREKPQRDRSSPSDWIDGQHDLIMREDDGLAILHSK